LAKANDNFSFFWLCRSGFFNEKTPAILTPQQIIIIPLLSVKIAMVFW
jgi:hypothetical protein